MFARLLISTAVILGPSGPLCAQSYPVAALLRAAPCAPVSTPALTNLLARPTGLPTSLGLNVTNYALGYPVGPQCTPIVLVVENTVNGGHTNAYAPASATTTGPLVGVAYAKRVVGARDLLFSIGVSGTSAGSVSATVSLLDCSVIVTAAASGSLSAGTLSTRRLRTGFCEVILGATAGSTNTSINTNVAMYARGIGQNYPGDGVSSIASVVWVGQ